MTFHPHLVHGNKEEHEVICYLNISMAL